MVAAPQDPARRPRPRLVDPLVDARVVLLEAPGGYGKTTVADLVIARWEHATIRARLRERTDLAGLLLEVRRGARRAGLRAVEEATNGDDDVLALDDVVHTIATHDEPITLAIDDVHHLDERSAERLADALGDGAWQQLGAARMVTAGRHLGPLGGLAATVGTRLAGLEDLRLDRDEQRSLFDGDGPPETLLDEVDRTTGGWAAAVALSVARWRADPTWTPATPAGARSILGELVASLLEPHPELALLAELPLIDDRVCELVGGADAAGSAHRSGLLTTRGRWGSMTDPIVASIRASGARLPDDHTLLAVARHYLDQGELAAAVGLLDRLGRAAVLIDLLAGAHWSELALVPSTGLGAALDALADDGPLAARPGVLVAAAQAVEHQEPKMRSELLDRARRIAAAQPDGGAVDRAARAEQARDAVAVHLLEGVTQDVEAIEQDAADEERVTVARALTALGRAQVFLCTHDGMRAGADTYQRAADLFRRAGEHSWLAETLARRGYTALFLEGHLAEGADELRRALALLPAGDVTRGIWLANYADVLDTIGRVPEADAAVAEVLEIGRRFRHAGLLGMGWWSASWLASRRGDRAGTERALDALYADLDRWARPGQVVEIHASAAECWARLGDEDRSAAHLEQARDTAAEVGYEGPWAIAAARHAALFGDPVDALEQLDRLEPEGVEGVIPASEPGRQMLRALAEARRGDGEQAAELVGAARATSTRFGVPDLVDRLEAEVVRRLSDRLDGVSTAGTVPVDVPPSAAVVSMLGGFSIRVGGRDQTPHPGFPSTLVKLLALKGGMTSEAAIDALWPEVDLTTGRSRLRNLLNRLRSRAGDVVVRDGELLRLRDDVTTDVDSFDAQAAEALQATEAEQVGLARLALALYPGQLLPGDLYEDWAAGPRERLKRRFLALVDLVAADAVARGDADEAVRLLDDAIAAEPLDQRRYQVACDVLVASGRVGSARTMARRAATALDEIGVALPSDLADLIGDA